MEKKKMTVEELKQKINEFEARDKKDFLTLFSHCTVENADFTGMEFDRVNLENVKFVNCDFTRVLFEDCNLNCVGFKGCKFTTVHIYSNIYSMLTRFEDCEIEFLVIKNGNGHGSDYGFYNSQIKKVDITGTEYTQIFFGRGTEATRITTNVDAVRRMAWDGATVDPFKFKD